MKVVSPYEELKSWFSLENYEQLKSLTIKELHTELAFREAIFDSVNFGWEDDNQNLRSICKRTRFSSTHFLRFPGFQPSAGILPASGYSGIRGGARRYIQPASAL
ncbi:hypothetical protein AD94_05011 [Klebsiella variicola]|nr:hypothetical protein AD94_05011 [Klebsiella variicola]